MKRIPTLIVKWLANKLGFKVVMLKSKNGIIIEGDKEVLPYLDVVGYFFKKEPLSRHKPKVTVLSQDEKLKRVTLDDLKELGIEVTPFTEEELKHAI